MLLTGTRTPERALSTLARHVPVVAITCGPHGVLAADQITGERARVPALPVPAIDPTGAGDVFGAGFVVGTLAGWALEHRLRFATLCAALSVQHFGGSLSSPGWGEIVAWWQEQRTRGSDLVAAYGFLDDLLPGAALSPASRHSSRRPPPATAPASRHSSRLPPQLPPPAVGSAPPPPATVGARRRARRGGRRGRSTQPAARSTPRPRTPVRPATFMRPPTGHLP